VTIEWDTTKSSKHAIDYIDSFNQSVLNANPCLGVVGCNFATPNNFAIPADPQVVGAGVTPIAGNLSMYGGTISSVSAYSYSAGAGFVGDKSASITITFTASVANPVLAWGGHIAARKDWGLDNSAVSIPGSPYHTRLIDLDGAGGNQDRSLSAEAVIFPGFIHIIKNTTGGDATFGYTASPSPLSNFNITTVNGTGEQDFNNITNFQSYTVTENSPPLHWVFDNLNCSVASANGGTQTVSNMTATIDLKEGEQVTCTYANHHAVNSPSISTLLSHASITVGGTIHDSATLTGATSDAGGDVKYAYYSSLTDCNAGTFASPGGTGAGDKAVAAGVVPNSNDATFNAAGTYYWRAFYSGDANNDPASSACVDETLVVGKASPTVTTQASPDVTLGVNGSDLTDSATLSGATSNAGNVITFQLFSDANCQIQVGSDVTTAVNGNGVYVSPPIHVDASGTYHWIANYEGDANNSPTANGCNGENENVVVGPRGPSIATQLSETTGAIGDTVHDSATLSNTTADASGTVSYKVFTDSACTQNGQDAGTVDVVEGSVPDSNGIKFSSPGTFYWQAVYSGDDNNEGATSACTDEKLVIINPHITVVKTPDEQVVLAGSTVSFTIQVINDGDSTLTNVKVTDAQAPGCARTSADIAGLASMPPAPAAGSTITYTCSLAGVSASFTNVADVSGTPPVGPPVAGEDTAHVTVVQPVTHPSISIVKNPKAQNVTVGNKATFKITVTNNGDVALTNVVVTDPLSPNCDRTIGNLAAGASVSYTCTRPNVRSDFTNVATATGTSGTQTVTAKDTAPVNAVTPFVPPTVKPKVVSHKKPKATG